MAINANIAPTVSGVFGQNLGNQAEMLYRQGKDNSAALRNAINTGISGYQAWQKIKQRKNENQKKVDAANEEQMNKEIELVQNEIAKLKAENEQYQEILDTYTNGDLIEYAKGPMTAERSAEIEKTNPMYVNLMGE